MKELGIWWMGMQENYERLIRERSAAVPENRPFVYLEIGVAYAGTLCDVADILSSIRPTWMCVGIDIPNGWSIDWHTLHANLKRHKGEIIKKPEAFKPKQNRVTVMLHPSIEMLSRPEWRLQLDFALIDGCHEKECVVGDLIAVEKLVNPGATVVFHDYALNSQGGQPQPHKGQPIGVRDAVSDLGWVNGTSRVGWTPVEEIEGQPGISMGVTHKLT